MTDHQQAAIEAVKAELDSQEAMHCTRVWEAWRYETMTEEDFVNVSEDDECVQALVAAAEPHLRKKWAKEWGIGDETSRPLYDARLRIGELEGDIQYKDREIRRLEFELNIALGFLEGAGE